MEKFKNIFSSSFITTYKRTFGILLLLIMAVAIPVTLGLINQRQDIRQRASEPDVSMSFCNDSQNSKYTCPSNAGVQDEKIGCTKDTHCTVCEVKTERGSDKIGDRYSVAECSQGGNPPTCSSDQDCANRNLPSSCGSLTTTWSCIQGPSGKYCTHSCGRDADCSKDLLVGNACKGNCECASNYCDPVQTVCVSNPSNTTSPSVIPSNSPTPTKSTTGSVDDPNSVYRGGIEKDAGGLLAATLGGFVSDQYGKVVSNVSVKLTGTTRARQSVDISTSTGSDGEYAFKNVSSGDYRVTITPPSCYTSSSLSKSVVVDSLRETVNFTLTKENAAACGGSASLACGSECNPADSNDCAKAGSCTECKWNSTARKYTCQSSSTATTTTSSSTTTGSFTGRTTWGGACGSSCDSDSSCAGAKDGCTKCTGTTQARKTCQRPSNTTSGGTTTGGTTGGTKACGATCSTSADCAGAANNCTTCVTGSNGVKSCQSSTNSSNINLVVKAKMPGIGSLTGDNNTPQHVTRSGTVYVYNTKNEEVKNGPINFSYSGGVYSGTVEMANLAAGNYYVKVRFDNTLKKLVPGIQNLQAGSNTLAVVTLVPGDLNNNNTLDISDYNVFISCVDPKSCTQKTLTDFNDDGKVTVIDYNILLRSFAIRDGD